MTIFIIIFGLLTLSAGIIIIINPEHIFGLLRKHIEKLGLQVLAVAVRLVLGALLINQSSVSRYPLAIEIIGWLSLGAAIVFAVMGRNNFKRLISWALSLAKQFGRVGGAIALCFGAFLIYAFL